MRILWISHLLPHPSKSGAMQRSYNLIKEVAKVNNVYIFAFNQKTLLPTEKDIESAKNELLKFCKIVKVFKILSDESKFAWYKLVFKSFFNTRGYTLNWTVSNQFKREIIDFVYKNSIDLLHCDTIGLIENIKVIKNIPMVLNHHNIESHMMLRRAKKENSIFKKFYFYIEGIKLKRQERIICKKFDINLVVSELDKQRLLQTSPNLKIEIIPNGVDIDYFKPKKNNIRGHNIVFTGSMDWYPNEDAVIFFLKNIWSLIKKEYPDATFTVVGRNPSHHIKKLMSGDVSLTLTGYVDDVRPFINKAKVYVCPIRDGGGTKLKLLEAMAMGKAIVTTSVGVEGLEVEDEKHLMIADDPKSFASKVKHLIENPNIREYLGQNARRLVEDKYSWKIIGKKLTYVYSSLKN